MSHGAWRAARRRQTPRAHQSRRGAHLGAGDECAVRSSAHLASCAAARVLHHRSRMIDRHRAVAEEASVGYSSFAARSSISSPVRWRESHAHRRHAAQQALIGHSLCPVRTLARSCHQCWGAVASPRARAPSLCAAGRPCIAPSRRESGRVRRRLSECPRRRHDTQKPEQFPSQYMKPLATGAAATGFVDNRARPSDSALSAAGRAR